MNKDGILVGHALRLITRAPVFPCKNTPDNPKTDKTPHTPHGFKDASRNPELVRWWWEKRFPNALIGVPTGETSDLFVIDADTARHDTASDWLAQNAAELPETRTHYTRSGGLHLLFRYRAGLKCSASKLARGVDTRGDGGYIIWWPAAGFHAVKRPLADVPQWIVGALIEPPPLPSRDYRFDTGNHQRRVEAIVRTVACAPEGQRNALAFWGACRIAELVRAGELGRIFAIDLVVSAAAHAGLPRPETLRTAQSAFKKIGA